MADEHTALAAFIARHGLPDAFCDTAERFYNPLGDWIGAQRRERGQPGLIIGVNGAQGTGKSTLCDYLAERLHRRHGYRAAVLSIDDIYLTRAERAALADRVHPLMQTRGVPGTHDVTLGIETLDALRTLDEGATLPLPRFDKSSDDRSEPAHWPVVTGPVDVILFEGWCVGAGAQDDSALAAPCNELERSEDADASWRTYVNNQLRAEYAALFARLDRLVYLAFPGFAAIQRWRTEQEHKLRARVGPDATGLMSDAQVERFIQHYERITRHGADQLPSKADAVLTLADDHSVTHLVQRRSRRD